MPEHKVTSEIYGEFNYRTDKTPSTPGNVISQFPFLLPKPFSAPTYDEDDDLDIERPSKEVITIEHAAASALRLVGLQVWRGALLLADWLLWAGGRGALRAARVLELGAGTGLASFVAALHAKSVVCTDIDFGGILQLIETNAKYNSKYIKSEFKVRHLDFTDSKWNDDLKTDIEQADIILAADVVYDDDITAAFVSTLQKILSTKPPKTLFMALEKRYVFTIENLDSVAPCYETFLSLINKVQGDWTIEMVPLDFPQYFKYDRVKDLVLMKISSNKP